MEVVGAGRDVAIDLDAVLRIIGCHGMVLGWVLGRVVPGRVGGGRCQDGAGGGRCQSGARGGRCQVSASGWARRWPTVVVQVPGLVLLLLLLWLLLLLLMLLVVLVLLRAYSVGPRAGAPR